MRVCIVKRLGFEILKFHFEMKIKTTLTQNLSSCKSFSIGICFLVMKTKVFYIYDERYTNRLNETNMTNQIRIFQIP